MIQILHSDIAQSVRGTKSIVRTICLLTNIIKNQEAENAAEI